MRSGIRRDTFGGARLLLAIGLLVPGCTLQDQQAMDLSEDDAQAIRQVHEAYHVAWLANDSAAVMAALTEDAVLMPHHGVLPVEGAGAIKQFWWPPESPPARITEFTSDVEEMTGSGTLAYLRGRFTLAFEYEGETYSNSGNFLRIFRKRGDGSWRMSRSIWNDPVG
jgi:uncharacterized protein (TIGR02246 family)